MESEETVASWARKWRRNKDDKQIKSTKIKRKIWKQQRKRHDNRGEDWKKLQLVKKKKASLKQTADADWQLAEFANRKGRRKKIKNPDVCVWVVVTWDNLHWTDNKSSTGNYGRKNWRERISLVKLQARQRRKKGNHLLWSIMLFNEFWTQWLH